MALGEIQNFTQPAIIFSLTGRIVINDNASEGYRERSLEEIRTTAVYKFVMKDVPDNILKSVCEVYDSSSKDADPILAEYLCRGNVILSEIANYLRGAESVKAEEILKRKYYNNGYVTLAPIDFLTFSSIANDICEKEENNIK